MSLQSRLLAHRRELRSALTIEDLADGLQEEFLFVSKHDSFMDKVGKLTETRESAKGFTKGMGPKEAVGRQGSAPKGTISRFLEDERKAGRRWYRRAEEATYPTSPEYAWWNLPLEARARLQEGREAGKYGGRYAANADKVPYFFLQDQSLGPWQDAGQRAAIPPNGWMNVTIQNFRSKVLPRVMREFEVRLASL